MTAKKTTTPKNTGATNSIDAVSMDEPVDTSTNSANTADMSDTKVSVSDGDLVVIVKNNSVSGHEILREDGSILAIKGHCQEIQITTNKKELDALQSALADKPWVEIQMKAAE
ncbi:hypothetical protein [Xenorhabdus sp. PB30.3]|uniref:hypothetical protein n=1 Tax=Xenorhabdus sp. PB30.3 TaxID=2788941 RepID=UPI001E59A471|nr:hypothetical protein [Xenorhabdus sp. PB30.3]